MHANPVTKARSVARAARKRLERQENGGADRGTQLALALAWQRLAAEGVYLPLREVEFRNTSQNGEDGILLYLMAVAGHGSRRAVEMCAGDGIENNSSNLALHHDWDVLMVDGDEDLLNRGRRFYARQQETFRIGPTISTEWITAENVNGILTKHGYDTDVDLLTIDMDGVDYWILKAIDISPRVIVVEYNNRIPPSERLTVPDSDSFVAQGGAWAGDGFFGASLAAFDELLAGRGYRLIGANRPNTNAFFLRKDVVPDMPAATVEGCLTSRWAQHQLRNWPHLANRDWVNAE